MNAVPVGLGQVHDIGLAGDAGVVDDDIQFAKSFTGRIQHGLDCGHIANIRRQGETIGPGLFGRGMCRFGINIGANHPRPGRCHGQGDGGTDTASRAGHKRYLAIQLHFPPPFLYEKAE